MLYLTEPIDEVAIQNLADYEGKTLVDVSKEDLNLGEDEEEKSKVRLLPPGLLNPVRGGRPTDCILHPPPPPAPP